MLCVLGLQILVAATVGWAGTARAQTLTTPEVSSTGPFTVAEGSVRVAQMTASGFSEDAEDLLWSILADADSGADGDKFKLRLDYVLEFVEPPDFEAPTDADADGTYQVTVKVSNGADTDPAEATADISVTVSDVGFVAFDASTLSVDFDENRHVRVATLDVGDPEVEWSLSGSDAGWFRIADGALRFRPRASGGGAPDYESPGDSDTDNVYEVTVAAAEDSTDAGSVAVSVTIINVDEPGAVSLSDSVPTIGAELTASLSDPDGGVADVEWVWERSAGRSAWEVIDASTAAAHTPTAADSEDYLRVTATYTDALGAGRTARAAASSPPLGELLSSLSVASSSARTMYPAFDPQILQYAVGCHSEVTLTLSAAGPDARVSVDGIQQPASNAEVTVSALHDGDNSDNDDAGLDGPDASDIEIVVSDADGSSTTYVVHCIPDGYPEITPIRNPASNGVIEDLILLHLRPGHYPSIVDTNGVPRFHRYTPTGGPYLRVFQIGGRYRYAFPRLDPVSKRAWIILDEHFAVLDDRVTTSPPLVKTNGHDFRILDNGNYLVMSYEPAVRDLRFMESLIPDISNPEQVLVDDTAVQIVTSRQPVGDVVFSWNSFHHFDLRDCTNHRFPHDYAHGNSLQLWGAEGRDQDWVVVGLRGCSAVALIDADTEETVAKIGRTNLSAEEWAAAHKGDPPLTILDDPHGEFCGQHAAWMQPHEHLVLFDNGNNCVADPRTGETFRPNDGPDRFSRVVEYGLDLDNGEAVFVRHHSLHGEENREGRSSGHVDVLANGDWLIGWGSASHDTDPNTAWPPDEAVTQADPDTGEEKFALRISDPDGVLLDVDGDGDTEREQTRVRPIPLSPAALARDRLELEASFAADSNFTHQFFTSAQARPTVVVSFNQPVVDFDEATTSITVSGGSLESVAPHVVAGERAHSYLLTLVPDGEAAISVSLVASRGCDAGGVCTAEGSTLSGVPQAHRVRYSSPPAIDADSLAFRVEENTTAIGRLSATDDDTAASGLVWSLASEVAGPDDAHFALSSSGVLAFAEGKDFEMPDDGDRDGIYETVVQVSDGDSTAAAAVEVTLTGVNEAPVVSGRAVFSFAENGSGDVAAFTADDPEGDSVGWSLQGADRSVLAIDGGRLRFVSPPNFEAPADADRGNDYELVVVASDGELPATLEVTLNVTGVNEVPAVSGPQSPPVLENSSGVFATYGADDPEGDSVGWSLQGADRSVLAIDGGRLRFVSPPNFEAPADADRGNDYELVVVASDGKLPATLVVTVTVGNDDETGAVSLSAVQPQAGESLDASLEDPDEVVASSVRWQWRSSADKVSWSDIDGAGSGSYTPGDGDVGRYLRAEASYTDGHGSGKDARADSGNPVRPAPVVNRPPVFPPAVTGERRVAEGQDAGSAVGEAIIATDPDDDRLTHSLVGGAGPFRIVAESGLLLTTEVLDHEEDDSHTLIVRAEDPSGRSATTVVVVRVEDVNEAPVVSAATGETVATFEENSLDDVAVFTAEDPDDGDTVQRWNLRGGDRTFLSIEAGVLRFVSPPDFEAPGRGGDNSYEVVVEAFDGELAGAQDFAVNVTNVDEPPWIDGPADPSVPENRRAVATYTATDPEGAGVGWDLDGPDGDRFTIPDGVLGFKDAPDFEAPADADSDNSYEVVVTASDGLNDPARLAVTVTVEDRSERRPPGPGPPTGGVSEPPDASGQLDASETFVDVVDGAYYEPAVAWMIEYGITTGCREDMFCPQDDVTRAQFVTFLWRAAGEPAPAEAGSQVFDDMGEGSYFDSAVGWAFQAGVTVGCRPASDPSGPGFCPRRPVTRAQAAALLHRMAGSPDPSEPHTFEDVNPDAYYAVPVAWMAQHGITTGYTPALFGPHRTASRAHAAVFIHRVATTPQSWATPQSPFQPTR